MVLYVLAAVLAGLPAAGCLYESIAAARAVRRFPPPGSVADVGGRRLHFICIGRGAPTVVFEQGGFNNSVSFETARTTLAAETRVCSYDRMGTGWSDPGRGIVSAGVLADDLRRLQDQAAFGTPLVIVTTSIGGLTTEMFARRYPDRVAGLLFADAANSDTLPIAESMIPGVDITAACVAIDAASRIGLVRLLDPFGLRRTALSEPSESNGPQSNAANRSAALLYGSKPWRTLCSLARNRRITQEEFLHAPPLRPDVPLIVLSADSAAGFLPARLESTPLGRLGSLKTAVASFRESHRRLAGRSTRGSWRVVPASSHQIASSQPDAVIDAVRQLLRVARGGA